MIEAHVVRSKKKPKAVLERELATLMTSCDYKHCLIIDDPLSQAVGLEVKQSDVAFLHLKEIEDDESEPIYIVFGDQEAYTGQGREGEYTCMKGCKDCYVNVCHEEVLQ